MVTALLTEPKSSLRVANNYTLKISLRWKFPLNNFKERYNMSIKTTLKASVAAAALVAVAAPVVSSPAEAGLANGNDNGVVISGSLVRSLMYTDNGSANDWSHIDGGADTASRMRILVKGALSESIAVGGVFEANLPRSNSSVATSGADVGATVVGDSAFGFRKTDISFTHATLGKLSIGQGDTASDNKPSLDSTGTNNAGVTYGSGIDVFDKTANTNGTTAGSHFASYFGGRKDRIRYDAPSIAGFSAGADFGQDGFWDVGLKYGATYNDIQIAAAISYQSLGADTPENNQAMGIAVKHASGISAGMWYGQEGGASDAASAVDGSSFGVEAGYTTTAISNFGATSFNVKYTESREANNNDFTADSVQFAFNQSMPAGVDVFASYENASFDDNNAATDLENLSVFLMGTKINF